MSNPKKKSQNNIEHLPTFSGLDTEKRSVETKTIPQSPYHGATAERNLARRSLDGSVAQVPLLLFKPEGSGW